MKGLAFIDPGAFRSAVRLERAIVTPDDAGGHAESWQEVSALFVLIEPVNAATRFGAGQPHAEVTHRITLRFRGDVESGMRFVKQDRVFAILDVHDPDETCRYLVCRAREAGR